jgi:UDP-glucose 4-epimerase
MKLLILGSTGFIGKNAVEYFSRTEFTTLYPSRHELNLLDTVAVENYLAKNRPDFILMCAVNITSLLENAKIYFNIERCSHLFGKMFTIGSGAEYDNSNYKPRMSENHFGNSIPSDIYGLSKYIISKDIESQKKNIYNFRVFGIFGPHEDYTRRFISNNICRSLAGLNISMQKNMLFDYIYVKDFLNVLNITMRTELKHRNYNLCANQPVSLLEIAQIIKKLTQSDFDIAISETGFKPEYSGDNTLLFNEIESFNWSNLESSISEMVLWYKNHPNLEVMLNKVR